jgi:hypothetical protein
MGPDCVTYCFMVGTFDGLLSVWTARGRPPKGLDEYRDVHIRFHPGALEWAHAQAKQRGIGYQTFINELLLRRTTRFP